MNITPDRILIIKLRAIGDVVLATPVIENLRRQYPESHIAFLTEEAAADIIKGNPFLDELIILERRKWQQMSFRASLKEQVRFYRSLRAKKFDLVFDLFGNPRSALLSVISGAPVRVGFGFRVRRYCYTQVIAPRGGEVHEVDFNLDALKALDIPIVSRQPRIEISQDITQNARRWISALGITNEKVVGLNPGGGWKIKRWPPAYFGKLADELIKLYGVRVLLLWGPGEEKIVESVSQSMKAIAHRIPDASLKELGAYISCCHLMISNDSGPMHIAAALNVPIIGIFGPTNPDLQGPFGIAHRVVRQESVPCLGCNRVTCKIGNICMTELDPAQILKQAEVFLCDA